MRANILHNYSSFFLSDRLLHTFLVNPHLLSLFNAIPNN